MKRDLEKENEAEGLFQSPPHFCDRLHNDPSLLLRGIFLPAKLHIHIGMVMLQARRMEVRLTFQLIAIIIGKCDDLMRNLIFFVETVDRMLTVRTHYRTNGNVDVHANGHRYIVLKTTLRTLGVDFFDKGSSNEITHDTLLRVKIKLFKKQNTSS